jgi:hypothetical protein
MNGVALDQYLPSAKVHMKASVVEMAGLGGGGKPMILYSFLKKTRVKKVEKCMSIKIRHSNIFLELEEKGGAKK